MEQWSSNPLGPWALQLGAGVLSGIAVGFALRRLALFALFIVGCGLLFVFALTQLGVATMNWRAFDEQLLAFARNAGQWAEQSFAGIGLAGAGFMAGVLVGWRLR